MVEIFRPRQKQEEVLQYSSGKMGVSAVPGSGKTQTLSYLAAKLIAQNVLSRGQEILIVTLVNSAVTNFEQRIEGFTKKRGLLPNMGYRVRTLHGLAHDIVRERPDLAGLSEKFSILDERESEEILQHTVQSWMRAHPDFIFDWTNPEIDLSRDSRVLHSWSDLAVDISYSFIHQAKDLQATPAEIRTFLDNTQKSLPLLEMGCDVYNDYQRALNYRSAVDFNDLIRLALQALQSDEEFLERLRYRWPYILEDEAQDSSRLQEEILKLLTGEHGNWVRVGDPNQAIYETFTTANPRYLRDFLNHPDVAARELPNSGRSTKTIIDLANRLIEWTRQEHPIYGLQDALVTPKIMPADEPGDPQPNPQDNPDGVRLVSTKYNSDKELSDVVGSLKHWLPDHPQATAAILVPRNERGMQIAAMLRKEGLEVVELLRSSSPTRETAEVLATTLRYLADPTSSSWLSQVYKVVHREEAGQASTREQVERTQKLIGKLSKVEDYLCPVTGQDWLDQLGDDVILPQTRSKLSEFRTLVNRWQEATLLPVDQLLLVLAQDLFCEPHEIALAHKLARVMENTASAHPGWHLPEFALELESVTKNKRKMIGFADEDTGFEPDKHKGKVAVVTMHKAKGLEWDRVYLLSVNNYDFPSCQPQDEFIGEKWFVRGQFNLQAETLAQLKSLMGGDITGLYMEYGEATEEARLSYAAERLRLLYVGITRARQELIITYNSGRKGNCLAALPLVALQAYMEGKMHARTTGIPIQPE